MADMAVNPLSRTACIPALWFAVIFALITYAAISMRAVLSPFEANTFIDSKRALLVAIGAFILWLSVRAIDRVSGQRPSAQIFAVLNVAIPGAIGLVLTREACGLATSGEFAQLFAPNVRLMLTWIGYFAAGVSTFLALGYHQQLPYARMGIASAVDINSQTLARADDDYELADLDFDPRRPN
jgi:hypothetical protein